MSENISGVFTSGTAIGGHCNLKDCRVEGSIISDGVEAEGCTIKNSFIEIGAKLSPNLLIENSFVDPDGEITPLFT
jgi:ADP-glucose pyrophosphorylase